MPTKKLRIGFVLDDRLDKPDGVQQYVTLLGAWLNLQGHEVHYLVGNSPNAKQANVHGLSSTVGVRFNKNRMAIPLPASRKKIQAILDAYRFDVLHVQMPYSPLLAAKVIALAHKNTAVIGTFHILPHGKISSLGTKTLSAVLKNNKKRFDTCISVSSTAAAFAKKSFGIQSTVLPNVVDLSDYKSGRPLAALGDKQNIVFLGRFVQRKGAAYAIAAYNSMLVTHPELLHTTRLVLCGDGPDRAVLEAQAQELVKNGADIMFTGFLPEQSKKDYLASAAIALFPATGGESFGIVLIEAMAAGAKVVIGGNNPGYATVLGEQPESLVEPKQTASFAATLYTMLTNKQAANTLHAKQQEVVRQYDIEIVGPKLLSIYSHAIAKRNLKSDTKV